MVINHGPKSAQTNNLDKYTVVIVAAGVMVDGATAGRQSEDAPAQEGPSQCKIMAVIQAEGPSRQQIMAF
ncbi:hypothetical protein NDU88_001441 [Pleurodeles waltl]|uniref:Uncharacterized protein n=1 Tax=Pleurodeles waltl TaxID=8319 RepID=A0AAV7VZY4_PLEWA|nr:hypothetical protein NDU88_001441 [Pleurodeles waltl]